MSGKEGNGRRPSAERHIPYRDGEGKGLENLLREALTDFYRRHHRLPVEVVVHPTLTDDAEGALQALEVRVPIAATGGCLAWEVWLGLDGGDGKGRR